MKTNEKFKAAFIESGVTKPQAADVLDVNLRTVYRWLNNERRMPKATCNYFLNIVGVKENGRHGIL